MSLEETKRLRFKKKKQFLPDPKTSVLQQINKSASLVGLPEKNSSLQKGIVLSNVHSMTMGFTGVTFSLII